MLKLRTKLGKILLDQSISRFAKPTIKIPERLAASSL